MDVTIIVTAVIAVCIGWYSGWREARRSFVEENDEFIKSIAAEHVAAIREAYEDGRQGVPLRTS